MPTRHDLEQDRAKRVRAAWNNQYAKAAPVQASTLSIEPGTFLTSEGEELKMLDPPTPTDSGVVFIDADEMLSFVHSKGPEAETPHACGARSFLSVRNRSM